MLERLNWRRLFIAGVVVAALFTIFAIITQSTFWFLMGGAVLALTGMALIVIGSLQKQKPQQRQSKKKPGPKKNKKRR